MRNLLILTSILLSFNLLSSLDIQRSDWEENTEKADQWFIEEAEAGPAPSDQDSDLSKTTRSPEIDQEPVNGGKEAQQEEN